MSNKSAITVTRACFCRIRATSTRVTARGDIDPPQPIPTVPMPGRKLMMIMNNGRFNAFSPTNIQLFIGGRELRWTALGIVDPQSQGFSLQLYDSIELPVDASVSVFALIDPNERPNADADVRILELG